MDNNWSSLDDNYITCSQIRKQAVSQITESTNKWTQIAPVWMMVKYVWHNSALLGVSQVNNGQYLILLLKNCHYLYDDCNTCSQISKRKSMYGSILPYSKLVK